MKKELDLNEIKRLYIEENKTLQEIADLIQCGKTTIRSRLTEMGIELRKKAPIKGKKKVSKDYLEEIKNLYLEGKSFNEIGEILGKSGKTIAYHIKNVGIEVRPNKKIDQKEFEKLWTEGKSDKEIANYFGVKESTIKTFRTKGENAGKFNIVRSFSQEDHKLSTIQEQMILGSLLGDMNLTSPTMNRHLNSRLSIVHSIKQEDYFMEKVRILDKFMGSYKLYTPKPDKRTGNIYETWRGNSKSHKVFTDIYNLLYQNNIKTITKNFLNKIIHPIALAFWFMDDGTSTGTIATNCFTDEEVELLVNWLKETWNIESTIQKNKNCSVLHISTSSRPKFEKLIYPYMIPSMYYKLKYINEVS